MTDPELALLIASCPAGQRRDELIAEMTDRVRWQLIRARPSRTGTCAAGLPIVIDDNDAYSSGYIVHTRPGNGVCEHGAVAWDTDPRRDRYDALLDELRPGRRRA